MDNYSIGQIALISHVAFLKMEDEKKELEKDSKGKKGGRRILNPNDKDNAAAYLMVASGLLG